MLIEQDPILIRALISIPEPEDYSRIKRCSEIGEFVFHTSNSREQTPVVQ